MHRKFLLPCIHRRLDTFKASLLILDRAIEQVMLQQLISCLNASGPSSVCYSVKRDVRTSLQYIPASNTAGLGSDLEPNSTMARRLIQDTQPASS
jgi:hypothetical protein